MRFEELLALAPAAGGFTFTVPDGWQQGPGAYGGLAFAWLARAVEAAAPDRPLRSLAVQICGPVTTGDAALPVERLRVGGKVSHLSARIVQDGEVRVIGTATLGEARASETWAPPMPSVPSAAAVPAFPPLPMMPRFTAHFEFRPCFGHLAFSGAAEAVSGGWIRLREPGPRADAALVAALLDTWWPAALVRETSLRPMATVAALLQFFALPDDPGAPCLVTVHADAGADGYMIEDRALWSPDGRLLGVCRQNMVYVR